MSNLKLMSGIKNARQLSKDEQKNVMGGMASMSLCCDPIAECCVPNNGGCWSQYPTCYFLYQYQFQTCCGSGHNCDQGPICG